MSRECEDPYELLGVAPGADIEEIRRAYYALAKRWHPDRAGTDTTFIFQRLLAAYEMLIDSATSPPRRRAPGVLIRRISSPIDVLLARGIARRTDDGVIELYLQPDEIAEGGMATIAMRVAARSPDDPARTIEEVFSAWLAIRPGVADGTIISPSVQFPGVLKPVTFRIHRAAA
jgi:hypothetical protein